MAEATLDLSGAQRAAIFLLGLGEAGAAAVMKHMDPKEVQRVGEAMAALSEVAEEQLIGVVQEFADKASRTSAIGIGAGDFTRRVMVQALGESKARNMLGRVMRNRDTKGLDALKWMDARSVAGLLCQEHPQIVAIVLASLDADHAAAVLALLPEEVKTDALLRIARLELIDPSALLELDQVLEKQLGNFQKLPPTTVNGLDTAAAILNHLDSSSETALLEGMKALDEDITEKVTELMFVFENLAVLDDRGMQRLIREISVDELVVALKGVDEKVQQRFFKNMSSRAADMLREDMEAKGPVKVSDVEAAQKGILAVASRLSDEGEIALGKGEDDFV
ncbi:MAG: flagellar motor switch protein FliG [Halioglobus sp.]|nr:flagellar motor switch protein FliG [Halioglobus sp.]